uniref:ATP synthase F0 subunit 8 n=1 Tax=Sinomicrurus macclellandi TaxID=931069 RepID=A0A7U3SD71_SINMA|nr:ATP synthase F0 subunit 8 [Sinomicrurus macclellandi]QPF22086.1 ATP synthase F0 subunit 8 [Sinomicrurus macclellandi]
MPQLNTIYIFLIYIWTWLMLHLIMQKTKALSINKTQATMLNTKLQKLTLTPPWT